ncbi:hypothetical protein P7M41_26245 [Vibrio parahaemolyticus]|nr:hypothetical protein [Vibrio parahaemolyticus]
MLMTAMKLKLTSTSLAQLSEHCEAVWCSEIFLSCDVNERQHFSVTSVCFLFPADVQQLSVVKEEVPPEQQEWSSSVDQEDPEPPHIKEEQEELWISQEGEQLVLKQETDALKLAHENEERDHVKIRLWTSTLMILLVKQRKSLSPTCQL